MAQILHLFLIVDDLVAQRLLAVPRFAHVKYYYTKDLKSKGIAHRQIYLADTSRPDQEYRQRMQ